MPASCPARKVSSGIGIASPEHRPERSIDSASRDGNGHTRPPEDVYVTRVPAIDLFAGAGGLSLAAVMAGCDVRVHVDSDAAACETLRLNKRRQRGEVLEADVTVLDGRELRERAGLGNGDPLLIVGGPPCQPFSKAAFWSEDGDDARFRRARVAGLEAPRPREHGHRPDERRFLVDEYMRLVVEADADGFVFENVASLLAPRNRAMFNSILATASEAGYATTVVRANAVEYGVAQKRQRVFVLGARAVAPSAPVPTHSLDGQGELRPPITAGDVIAPFSGSEFFEPEEVVEGRWAEHLRSVPPGWNYKAHTAWAGHPNPTFVTETRFWNFLLKLSPDLPSWTIPAQPGPWTGPFHWESRRLRTPEMAALQGFPVGYKFAGSRRDRVRQIGNAAPPPLGAPMIKAAVTAISERAGLDVAA
jgi:DNA (cytosine-5)-methyltransferase 1